MPATDTPPTTTANLDEVGYVWDCPVCGTVNDEATDKVCIVCDEPAPTALGLQPKGDV